MIPPGNANDSTPPAHKTDSDSSSSASSRPGNSKGGDTDLQRKDTPDHVAQDATAPESDLPEQRPPEHGGQTGLEPTRYGDWEKKGRCTDF